MRKTGALFAGEASGHYYFRDNFYADNGMIPFLLVLEYLSVKKMSLAEAVQHLRTAYPVSGEINFSFETRHHQQDALAAVSDAIQDWGNPCFEAPIDGLSVRFLSGSPVRSAAVGGSISGNRTQNRCYDSMSKRLEARHFSSRKQRK